MSQAKKATGAKPLSLMQQAAQQQATIYADMDALSKRYGPDLFRVVGQRYFKQQREEATLQAEIARREEDLAKLREKIGR